MRSPLRAAAALAAVAALVTGCSSADAWSEPHASPTPVGALGPGFVDPSASPTPEATVTPRPGSWDDVHPPAGYRVVLVTAGHDRPTTALVTAVRDWARVEDVDLRTVTADDPSRYIAALTRAMAMAPDLVVTAGNDLVDPLAAISPSHLAQHFLVVGAELAEPTENVTAADWTGASFRGEGLGMSSAYDARSFTAARCAAAVRAGVAAVLSDLTGIVLWLDEVA